MKSHLIATLCVALGSASFLSANARAAITVDGTKDADYGTTPLSVQVHTASWGGNNTLANCFAFQEGTKLNLFLGGRVWGNALVVFIDSKAGGLTSISSSTLANGGDNYQVNNFGGANPFVFENGFAADYMLRVYGDGANAWVNICDLQAASNVSYAGNAGDSTVSNTFISAARVSWNEVTVAFSDVTTGLEAQLDLSKMGVPLATGGTVKIVALVVNGGSDYAPNQFLGPLPAPDLLAGSIKGLNLETLSGTQTVSISIAAVADIDGDGIPDSEDPDIDGDGLLNTVETNNGTFVDANNTGTNPNDADSDDDGYNDGAEVAGSSALGRATNPLKKNYATLMVAGDFLTPSWSDAPTSVNTMTLVSGQQFAYTLNYNFRASTAVNFKFVANSWANNWGGSAGTASTGSGNIVYTPAATGFHTFSFNHDALTYSLSRTVFADFAAYAAAYALVGDETADDDSDGLTNGAEFTANTDPTRANDAEPPVITLSGNALVAVVLNGSYTDAGATATDNVDATVSVNSTGTVDTSVVGTSTITYSASDAAGNAAATKTRTVVVYDPAAGFASRFTSVTVPGNYTSPGTWDASGSNGNSMTLIGNFKWRLAYEFTSARSIEYKIVGGADWASAYQWGAGGALGAGNATANVVAGLYYFELDELLNTGSLTWVGSTFTGWGGGAPLTTETLLAYAIGGASSLAATDGVKPNSTVDGGNLVLTAIVRTDNPKLTVVGEAVADLTDYATPASVTSVNGVDTVDQIGVPSGCKRRTFTIPQGSDTKKFLRLKATLAP